MDDMVLLDTSLCRTKEISLVIILGGFLLVVNLLLFAFPLPVSIFILYVFKDYRTVAVQSIYLKSVLLTMVYMIFMFDMIVLSLLLFRCVGIVLVCKATEYYDFNFSSANVMKIGMVSCITAFIPAIPLTEELVKAISYNKFSMTMLIGSNPIIFLTYIFVFVLVLFGLMYLKTFNTFREYMDGISDKVSIIIT